MPSPAPGLAIPCTRCSPTSSSVPSRAPRSLDLLAGEDGAPAAERLIGVGIVAYLPTALSGITDWADSEPVDDSVRRTGVVHAGVNAVALSLYSASLGARKQGAHGRGVALGLAGAGVLALGGWLGGHLSYRQGVGPDQTVFDEGPSDWSQAGDASQLSDGEPARVVVDDTPVLLLRSSGQLFAIHDRCSHRGCSLSDGEIDGEEVDLRLSRLAFQPSRRLGSPGPGHRAPARLRGPREQRGRRDPARGLTPSTGTPSDGGAGLRVTSMRRPARPASTAPPDGRRWPERGRG